MWNFSSTNLGLELMLANGDQHPQDDDDLGFAIIPKSSALPSKKRARAESSSNLVSHFNQRNQSSQQSRRRQASPSPEQLILTSKAPIILQSAFRPPSKKKMWTRDPPMGSFQFLRTSAECQPDGQVKFSEATETEKIELSLDWQKGEDVIANPGSFSDETGFIGRGFTKRGIYVCEIFMLFNLPFNSSNSSFRPDFRIRNML